MQVGSSNLCIHSLLPALLLDGRNQLPVSDRTGLGRDERRLVQWVESSSSRRLHLRTIRRDFESKWAVAATELRIRAKLRILQMNGFQIGRASCRERVS